MRELGAVHPKRGPHGPNLLLLEVVVRLQGKVKSSIRRIVEMPLRKRRVRSIHGALVGYTIIWNSVSVKKKRGNKCQNGLWPSDGPSPILSCSTEKAHALGQKSRMASPLLGSQGTL